MSRIANAWRALMGAEPEVREVEVLIGDLEAVTIYKHESDSYYMLSDGWLYRRKIHHPSCEAAFAAIPQSDVPYVQVAAVKAIRVGNRYFEASGEVKVAKPKRAKGAK